MKKLFLLFAILSMVSFGQIPTNGLVAYYPFDSNVNDLSGNNNNGVIMGGVTSTTDRFGNSDKAMQFNGIDGYIHVESSVSLKSITTALTFTGWILVDQDHNIVSSLIDKAPTNAYGQYNFTFEHVNGGQFKLYLNGHTSSPFGVFLQHTIPIAQWCFVACSWNGTQATIYLNGSVIGVNDCVGVIQPENNPVAIGLQKAGSMNNHFKGKIDDVRIYNRALSDIEIEMLYHENGWNNGNIVAHYTFSEMTGNSLIDHSGNGNHGQINGATWQSNSGLRCLSFDGVNDYAAVPHNSIFNVGTGDFTIEAQFKTSVIPTTSWTSIFSKHNTANWHDKEIFLGIVGTTGLPTFDLSDGNGYFERATGTTNVCDDLVHTIRGVRENNQLKIYVDGDLQATASATINPDNNNPINIGRSSYNNGYGYFNGTINRISFWKNSLPITPVEYENTTIVKEFRLFQNFPNPFNPNTKIRFNIPESNVITLKVFDLLGNEISTLINEERQAGSFEVEFDASKLASGIYIYRLQSGNNITMKKMVYLK